MFDYARDPTDQGLLQIYFRLEMEIRDWAVSNPAD